MYSESYFRASPRWARILEDGETEDEQADCLEQGDKLFRIPYPHEFSVTN